MVKKLLQNRDIFDRERGVISGHQDSQQTGCFFTKIVKFLHKTERKSYVILSGSYKYFIIFSIP